MEKHQKNHFWNFALFTRFNLSIGLLLYHHHDQDQCWYNSGAGSAQWTLIRTSSGLLDCAVQCAGQFRGLGLKSSSRYLVFSCRGRLLLHSRHRESKNKRHPTCLFILWNICGKQENDKHPCSKSNIFDLWNFRNIIYTFDRAEFRFEQNPNQWLRTEDIWMAPPQSHSAPHLNLGHVQSAV